MMKRYLILLTVLTLVLAGCATAEPTAEPGKPTGETAGGSFDLTWLAALPESTILFQQDYLPGFTLMELHYAFGRFASFTLYADGRVIYLEEGPSWEIQRLMQAQLTPEETLALYQQILDQGLARLESHTDMCQTLPDGTQACIADASTTVLRAWLNDQPWEIQLYANFSNDAAALDAILMLAERYTHSSAQVYRPSGATLFLGQLDPTGMELNTLPWPLDPALLAQTPGLNNGSTAFALSGETLQALLNALPRNTGEFFFEVNGAVYRGMVVPWLPGLDYTGDIEAAFGKATG